MPGQWRGGLLCQLGKAETTGQPPRPRILSLGAVCSAVAAWLAGELHSHASDQHKNNKSSRSAMSRKSTALLLALLAGATVRLGFRGGAGRRSCTEVLTCGWRCVHAPAQHRCPPTSSPPLCAALPGVRTQVFVSADEACGEHGHLEGQVCVCDNPWPDPKQRGWTGGQLGHKAVHRAVTCIVCANNTALSCSALPPPARHWIQGKPASPAALPLARQELHAPGLGRRSRRAGPDRVVPR